MNIGKFDLMVLVVMGLAVVSMSFVFPALGLSGVSTEESDIPSLNIQEGRFDLVGDSPRQPSSPTEGVLFYDTTQSATFSENSIWLEGNTNDGVQLTLLQNASDPSQADVLLTEWNGTVASQDRIAITENNSSGVLSTAGYQIAVETTDRHNPPDLLEVSWRVDDDPRASGAFGFLTDLVNVVAWGVTWIIWFMTSIVEGTLNAIGIIFDVMGYLISLMSWLITTYGTIVTSAPSWVGIFVAIPGIVLSAVLAKIVIIGIQLLPST